MKTTLDLDEGLVREAKQRAAKAGMTLKSFVEEALRARLAPVPKKRKGYRLDLPVMEGSAPPGVEVADRRALYDFLGSD